MQLGSAGTFGERSDCEHRTAVGAIDVLPRYHERPRALKRMRRIAADGTVSSSCFGFSLLVRDVLGEDVRNSGGANPLHPFESVSSDSTLCFSFFQALGLFRDRRVNPRHAVASRLADGLRLRIPASQMLMTRLKFCRDCQIPTPLGEDPCFLFP